MQRSLTARDELRRTKEGIDKLPPKCREVILLQKVDGLTDREAAESLGVSWVHPYYWAPFVLIGDGS
jgi:DNA-directed RNA polymerase specialized sigma24 family protein